MTDPKKRRFIIEVKKKERWKFRSGHNNEVSADANFESAPKALSVRMKDDGVVVREREGVAND